MARRSARKNHLIGSVTKIGVITQEDVDNGRQLDVGTPIWEIKSLCNEKWSSTTSYGERWENWPNNGYVEAPYGFAKFEWAVDCCTACQSKFYAKKLREMSPPFRYKLGERLVIEGDYTTRVWGLNKYHYKSVYPVIDTTILGEAEEKIVGFICIENGFGQSWKIRRWNAIPEDDEKPQMVVGNSTLEYIPGPRYEGAERQTYKTSAKGFGSKEEALFAFPWLEEQDLIPTYRQVYDDAAARIEQRKADEIERQQRRDQAARDAEARRALEADQRASLLADILDGLTDPDLSNFNRDTLFRVALKAGYSREELESGPLAVEAVVSEPETNEWGEVIG